MDSKLQNEIYLDNMLSAIFCVSSHASGFSGTTVKKFLADVLYQCQYHAGFTERIEFDQSNYNYFFASINDLCVPFLCSPNSTWPEFAMNVPDFNLGNLTRSTNDVKVNLEAGPYIAGESRGWTKKLGMKELTKILPKIPKSTRLFIILTSGTQSSYFDNDGYKNFKTTKKLRNMLIVKVSVGKNPRFKKIVGIPHVTNQR
ncbi:hypothetical protein HK098_002705 [Nowakowskiella sp. JEL0407]|nr:hypothetical protein HK098_002705 [Nowakowskiella sp. JEL0407]